MCCLGGPLRMSGASTPPPPLKRRTAVSTPKQNCRPQKGHAGAGAPPDHRARHFQRLLAQSSRLHAAPARRAQVPVLLMVGLDRERAMTQELDSMRRYGIRLSDAGCAVAGAPRWIPFVLGAMLIVVVIGDTGTVDTFPPPRAMSTRTRRSPPGVRSPRCSCSSSTPTS